MPVLLRSLLRLLTLLLGIFYLDTVCQTDAEDARAYYARGIQEYVAAPEAVALAAPTTRPTARARVHDGVEMSQRRTRWQRQIVALATPCPRLALPPIRRWLRWGVLQV